MSIARESLLVFPTPSISYLGVWYLRGGWCRPWIWDWGLSCPVPLWVRGPWALTRTGWRRGRGWLFYFSSCRGRWYRWRYWCISNSIYQLFPAFVVKSEVCTQLQQTKSIYSWENEHGIIHQGFLAAVKYTSNLLFIVAPRR